MEKENLKKVEVAVEQILQKNLLVKEIVSVINKSGGASYLVGGAVRDIFLQKPIKDIDIEVHKQSLEKLSEILSKFGVVDLVGKSFGVLRLHGLDVDWSIPRKDSSGRKPEVQLEPNLSFEDAFRRRDLTINSMGINLITKELVDPFNGLEDIKTKTLRATDPDFFIEDPLRFFRVMQFIGRFEFTPDQKLNEICKKIEVDKVSKERIETEFEKLILKSQKPSLAFRWLKQIGRLKEILPELYETIDVPQNPKWHPEGDVFEHTMQALDEAELISEQMSNFDKLVLMYAALCHDLGKPETTEKIDGEYKSIGHEIKSAEKAKTLLKRITNNKDLIKTVSLLVKCHMMPLNFVKNNAGAAAYKRLANKLNPYTNLKMLSYLVVADKSGRKANPRDKIDLSDVEDFINHAKKYGVYESIEKPILQGKDFLDVASPGPELGELVKKAYEIQIDSGVQDKAELKKLTVSSLK